MGEFADGGRLADAVHTHHHDHVRFGGQRSREIQYVFHVVLLQQLCNLVHEQGVEFACTDILVAFDALLYTGDDAQCGLYADIRGDKRLFEVIQHIIVNRGFTGDGVTDLTEDRFLAFLETFVEGLFLFSVE